MKLKIIILISLFIFLNSYAFEYVYNSNTVLFVTHLYGYKHSINKRNQSNALKVIDNVLLNNGKVLIAYDPEKDEIDNLLIKYYDKIDTKLFFTKSITGEFIYDPYRGTGLKINQLINSLEISSSTNIYSIGNFYTACHTHSLIDLVLILDELKLNLDSPRIQVDLNLVTGRTELSLFDFVEDFKTYPSIRKLKNINTTFRKLNSKENPINLIQHEDSNYFIDFSW